MDYSPLHQSFRCTPETLSEPDTQKHIEAWLMSLRQAFPANPLAPVGLGSPSRTSETGGLIQLTSFARYDPVSHSWKTPQDFLPFLTSEQSSVTWPRRGTMQHGLCYRPALLVHHIHVKDCSLWPTPTASEASGGGSAKMAERALRKERRARSGRKIQLKLRDLSKLKTGGQLNPRFLEWLMGVPIGWTDIKPLATDRFQLWLKSFGN